MGNARPEHTSQPDTDVFALATLSAATVPATALPSGNLRLEEKQANDTIVVQWSIARSVNCAQWLQEQLQ